MLRQDMCVRTADSCNVFSRRRSVASIIALALPRRGSLIALAFPRRGSLIPASPHGV
jgi:hypothetical protein